MSNIAHCARCHDEVDSEQLIETNEGARVCSACVTPDDVGMSPQEMAAAEHGDE